jgi:hypothetical protein
MSLVLAFPPRRRSAQKLLKTLPPCLSKPPAQAAPLDWLPLMNKLQILALTDPLQLRVVLNVVERLVGTEPESDTQTR